MANKNTKNIRNQIRKAGRKGEDTLTVSVPVYNFHSSREFKNVTFPTARVRADGLVSSNRKRNLAMRVYQNKDVDGKKESLTVHEPLLKGEFIKPRSHTYITYRQPKADRSKMVVG